MSNTYLMNINTIESSFIATGILMIDPKVKKNKNANWNDSASLCIKLDSKLNIVTPNDTKEQPFIVGTLSIPNSYQKCAWTDNNGLPNYLVKGATIIISGILNSNCKLDTDKYENVYTNIKTAISVNSNSPVNIASGAGIVVNTAISTSGILYTIKEKKRSIGKDKQITYRYYRLFTPNTKEIIKEGKLLTFVGHLVAKIFKVKEDYPKYGVYNAPLYYSENINGNTVPV